jgi:hypothetical protein
MSTRDWTDARARDTSGSKSRKSSGPTAPLGYCQHSIKMKKKKKKYKSLFNGYYLIIVNCRMCSYVHVCVCEWVCKREKESNCLSSNVCSTTNRR